MVVGRTTISAVLLASLAMTGCGKKGPLLYPDMLVPAPVSGLAAMQSGNSNKIIFTLPDKDMAGRSLRELAGVKLYRRITPAASARQICPVCTTEYQLFKTLYLDAADNAQIFGRTVVFIDGDAHAKTLYSYYVTAFSKDGSSGQESSPVNMIVSDPIPAPLVQVVAEPTEIALEFVAPPLAAGSDVVGYSIYRALRGQNMPYMPINPVPLATNSYRDSGLERDTDYRYLVRMVVRLPDGEQRESLASLEVEARLRNDLD